jgi:hypothetical protein
MMMIYMIYAANWVDLIEVLLGANMIPKRTALGYSVMIPTFPTQLALLNDAKNI